jgi:hypothetical protein
MTVKSKGDFPPPTAFYPEIPEGVVQVIKAATAVDPKNRLQTVEEMARVLGSQEADGGAVLTQLDPNRLSGPISVPVLDDSLFLDDGSSGDESFQDLSAGTGLEAAGIFISCIWICGLLVYWGLPIWVAIGLLAVAGWIRFGGAPSEKWKDL